MTTQRPTRRAAEPYPQVEVTSRSQLRTWLTTSHATSRGAWVVTWKRHVAEAHVDACTIAERALCFGWVDSLPRALDADRSMLLITPRRATNAWSAINKRRVERLLAEGQMTASGLAVVEATKRSGARHLRAGPGDGRPPPRQGAVAPPKAVPARTRAGASAARAKAPDGGAAAGAPGLSLRTPAVG